MASLSRVRGRLAAFSAALLLATTLNVVPVPAWALPPRQAPAVPASPSVQHVTKAASRFAPPKDTSTPYRATATAWPAESALNGRVKVLGHDKALAAGIDGVLLSVAPATGDTQVSLDYGSFAQAYGGNYGSRLRMVQLPPCALSDPQRAECRTATPLKSTNSRSAHTVTATVPAQSKDVVLAALSSTDPGQEGGAAGNYAATGLKPSGSWTSGSNTGAFTYSNPIVVPRAAAGPVPSVALAYNSSSVDGQTSATAAQSSWAGDGWTTPDSYIEQTFVSCSDKPEGSAPPTVTADMCYAGPILTFSLNGTSGSLVWDAAKSVWKPQSDKGEVVAHVTGSGNGSGTYNTDYWTITTRDGTQYSFGRNHLPGWASGNAATNSVDSEPVYSAHAPDTTHTDPCWNTTYTLSVCTMAYKWHLDYAVDVHGNAMSYFYNQDTNFYGERNGAKKTSYVRDSHLARIDYGFTDGNAYGTVPNQVVFNTGDRCLSGTCQPLNAANAPNWPDVPFDFICAAGSSTCQAGSPSFFSTVRLTSIETRQYSPAASAYKTVDSYALSQTLPAPHDLTSPALWLSSITRTGYDINTGASITNPPVTFTPTISMPNRVSSASFPELDRFRVQSVTTETGAVITATYSLTDPCTAPVSIAPASNTSSCYPVNWTPDGYSAPFLDWFNKYVVTKVTITDPTGLAPATTTSYQYLGGTAWHYDDNEVVQSKYRTYGQFRGYGDVKTFTGDATNDPRTLSETTYYRGMSHNNGGAALNITDSQGGTHDDTDQLAGSALETTSYLGEGGGIDNSTITSYWVSAANASRSRTGLPALTANYVAVAETFARQATTSTGSTVWRYTETDTTYDTVSGLPTAVYGHTVPADTAFDRCTTTTYAAANTTKNLVGLVSRTETDSKACNHFTAGNPASVPGSLNALTAPASVTRPGDVVADTLTFYDDPMFATTFPQAAAPSKGERTMVRQAVDATAYRTQSRASYDTRGRPITTWDANGNQTGTAYAMSTVGLTIGTTTTNALGQSASTTIDPARAVTLTITDANTVVTTQRFDPMGRITAVWTNSRSTSLAANYTYAYQLSNTGTTAATTNRMTETGVYLPSVVIYDAQLRVRQQQATAAAGTGRVISDTIYDSRGWIKATYNAWYDAANAPGTAIASATSLGAKVNNQDQYTYDGLGRPVVDTKLKNGVVTSTTTTVRNGDRTTVIPPTGGVITASVLDTAGRSTELDQYTSPPTLHTPANTFTGIWTVTGGTKTATTYGYDSRANLNRTTDSAGNAWISTFDILGRRTATTDPDAGSSTSSYDANGNLIESKDSRNATTSYTYDALNRKTAQFDAATASQSPTNQTAAWVYDNANTVAGVTHAIGHLTTQTSYAGGNAYVTQQKDFNVFGESLGTKVTIPTAEGALGGDYIYGHFYTTNLGLPLKDVLPGSATSALPAETVVHTYTTNGLPNGLTGLTGYEQSTAYDAWGRPTQGTFGAAPNQSYLTTTYDPHTGRIVDQLATRQTGTPANVDEQAYTYDLAGNITKQVGTRSDTSSLSETQCFGYDALDRLTNAWTANDNCAVTPTSASRGTVGDNLGSTSTYWTAWNIDLLGRRTQQTQYGATAAADVTTAYTYNTTQPHTLSGTAKSGASTGTTSYGYDATGNITTRNAAEGNQTLTWNNAGHLTQVSGGTAGTSQFVYDADGSLLLQKDPGTTVLYLPGQQLTLNTGSGTVTGTRYYALPGGGTAVRTGTAATAVTFQLSDLHGTPAVYLNYTASVPSWRQSTPYGAPRGGAVTAPDNHGFLNKPADASTGLTSVGARYYDPITGRFASVDPVLNASDPQSFDGYSYASNNPVTFSDPSGLCPADRCPGYGQNPGLSSGVKDKDGPGGNRTGESQPKTNPQLPWLSKSTNSGSLKNMSPKELKTWLADKGCDMTGESFTNADAMRCAQHSPDNWMAMCVQVWGQTYEACGHDPFDKGDWRPLLVIGALICGPMIVECVAGVYDFAAYGGTGAAFLEFGGLAGTSAILDTEAAAVEADVAAEQTENRLTCTGNSFSADTRVAMADGSTKAISKVEVGDRVLTSDPSTGVTSTHVVTALHRNTDTALTDLTVSGDGPTVAVVHTTQEHLFWSDSRHRWIPASELKPGEVLHSADAFRTAAPAAMHVDGVVNFDGIATMYNLTVSTTHTYYVIAGKTPVLVHNEQCRNARGEFQKSDGTPSRVGANDEKLSLDMLETEGFEVRRGAVTVDVPIGENGELVEREYDGAVKLDGTWYGVETKGGAFRLRGNQPQADAWLNTPGNSAVSRGNNGGLTIEGTLNVWVG
ncbi:RHS repeat-associated core domain-containing protein [Dactylosporangium sp. NPDC000244]|uniref:RHS repeat-associated core domain-containing protein n=1 Tax=Dactylosporangium sp. NPDC000244 TaxID=3154365 RepID=UPI003325631F